MGALERALAEEDAVVRDDRDRVALDVGEAADERLAVERLELVEPAPVDEAGDDLADVDRASRVGRDGRVQAASLGVRLAADGGRLGIAPVPRRIGRLAVDVGDDRSADREGLLVVGGKVIDDARDPGVDLAPAEVLGA